MSYSKRLLINLNRWINQNKLHGVKEFDTFLKFNEFNLHKQTQLPFDIYKNNGNVYIKLAN